MISKIIKLIVFSLILNGISCKKSDSNPEEEQEQEIIIRDIDGDYYVSTAGNDSDPGTIDKPWKTIQKAANTAAAGNIVVILQGTYDEFVIIKNSGTSVDSRITIISKDINGAKCRGFKIQGDYVTIDGFNIESQSPTNWIGIYVDGTTYANILNNYIHDCPTGGINVTVKLFEVIFLIDSFVVGIIEGNWLYFHSMINHLFCPTIALATIPMAVIARMMRSIPAFINQSIYRLMMTISAMWFSQSQNWVIRYYNS